MNKLKSKRYYYDVNSDTIYAPEFSSKKYYHEESHAKDMARSWYRKINSFFDIYLEYYCLVFLILVWFNTKIMLLGFLPYAIFRTQEELRAELYARKKIK